jgi:hypothetical protein
VYKVAEKQQAAPLHQNTNSNALRLKQARVRHSRRQYPIFFALWGVFSTLSIHTNSNAVTRTGPGIVSASNPVEQLLELETRFRGTLRQRAQIGTLVRKAATPLQ